MELPPRAVLEQPPAVCCALPRSGLDTVLDSQPFPGPGLQL